MVTGFSVSLSFCVRSRISLRRQWTTSSLTETRTVTETALPLKSPGAVTQDSGSSAFVFISCIIIFFCLQSSTDTLRPWTQRSEWRLRDRAYQMCAPLTVWIRQLLTGLTSPFSQHTFWLVTAGKTTGGTNNVSSVLEGYDSEAACTMELTWNWLGLLVNMLKRLL